ncbi:hypothetical protein HPP92_006294 [Vanilla planifolia]|uniref:RRM domain-containing protein n=1 Tax=Vanilla planifolia TaxID=51239 RepID=A0A835VDZ4_VANPL|nr:hypothetical protein HPP92_006294 [Vanilla planifolia]
MMQPAGGMAPPQMFRPPMDQQHQIAPTPQHAMPPSASHPIPMQQPPAAPPTQQQQWQMPPQGPNHVQYPQAFPQSQYPSGPPPLQYPSAQPQPPMWNQQPSQIPPPLAGMPAPPVQHPGAYAHVQALPQPTNPNEVRTLWIGDLQYWMDESYVYNCFVSTGEVVSIKLIRNKQTGQLEGYGFIDFMTRATAERVLQTYNGTAMPGTEQPFRLNWALAGEKRGDDANDYTIFVGDLAPDVTDYMLQETFRGQYSSVKGAKVVIDRVTGRSKCYGFVKFGDANEQARAMTEMNGVLCSTRPMRIGPAANKKSLGIQNQAPPQSADGSQSENDPNNTTIFVGGLDQSVTEDALRQLFSSYGEVIHVKVPIGKRCGFVQFAKRACAEEALLMLQGTVLGGQSVRLSWGRSPSSKQPQQDSSALAGNYYAYGQGYESYGYPQTAQDPNMYAYGSYAGYANYPQQQ